MSFAVVARVAKLAYCGFMMWTSVRSADNLLQMDEFERDRSLIPFVASAPSLPIAAETSTQLLPRPVSIDACNVGRSACPRRKLVSATGILNMIRHFVRAGHKVVAFMPLSYRPKNTDNGVANGEPPPPERVRDGWILLELEMEGLLHFTPVRRVNETTTVTNYDDLQIIQRAKDMGGVVVSNDRYLEIQHDPEYDHLRSTIEQKLVKPNWFYGANKRRKSQSRNKLLDIGGTEAPIGPNKNDDADKLFAFGVYSETQLYISDDTDGDYAKVVDNQLTEERKQQLIRRLDELADKQTAPSTASASTSSSVSHYVMDYAEVPAASASDELDDFISPPLSDGDVTITGSTMAERGLANGIDNGLTTEELATLTAPESLPPSPSFTPPHAALPHRQSSANENLGFGRSLLDDFSGDDHAHNLPHSLIPSPIWK